LSADDIKKLKGELDAASQGKINQAVTASAITTGNIQTAIDSGAITKEEAKTLLAATGYKPTSATEADQFSGAMTEEQAKAKINEYINPLIVTQEEAKQALIDAGVKNPTQEDVNNLMGQYAQTELKGKATTAAPIAQVNSSLFSVNSELAAIKKQQADRAEADRVAAEKAAADKVIADKLAAEKAIADKAAADKAAADAKVAAERQLKISGIQMGVASLLPQIQSTMAAAQQPKPAPVPLEVVKTTDPFSFESPLDVGYFGEQTRTANPQKNTQNQDGTVKIASGGSVRGLPALLRKRG
jgi:hypothetical protein